MQIHDTLSFVSSTLIRKSKLRFAKNQANVKQIPEAELFLFENISRYSSTLSSKNNSTYPKKYGKK